MCSGIPDAANGSGSAPSISRRWFINSVLGRSNGRPAMDFAAATAGKDPEGNLSAMGVPAGLPLLRCHPDHALA